MDLTTFWWKLFIKNVALQKSKQWDNPKRTDDSPRRTVIRICYEDNDTMKLSLRPLDIIEDHGWKICASSTRKIHEPEDTNEGIHWGKKGNEKKQQKEKKW